MANLVRLLLVLSFLAHQFEAHIVLPVIRDHKTLQYLTAVHLGSPPLAVSLVLDLGGPLLWVDRRSAWNPIPRCSLQCFKAKNFVEDPSGSKNCFYKPDGGAAPIGHCGLIVDNSILGSEAKAELAEADIVFQSANGEESNGSNIKVKNFIFASSPAFLSSGLAAGACGMLGLGRSNIGMLSQVSNAIASQRKFSLCLTSSQGFVLLGDGDVNTFTGSKVANLLMYTPLLSVPRNGRSSQEYFIKVKSLKINNIKLSVNFDGVGVTKISTIVPYTTMASFIFRTFVRAYETAAASMNLTRVAPVSPFSLCFSDEGVEETQLGPLVPAIDLTLQSEMVSWSFTGKNSMVRVSEGRLCLGFLDGGSAMDASEISIVIGGYQLLDYLLEFNVGTNMLGFSKSLVMEQSSCSDLVMSRPHSLVEAL